MAEVCEGTQISLDDFKSNLAAAKDAICSAAQGVLDGKPHIYLHWTAGDYNTHYSDYHVNIGADGTMYQTCDFSTQTAHTYMRNTGSIGITLCAAAGAEAGVSLGSCPPTEAQVNAMAQATQAAAAILGIPVDLQHVMTHGEAGDNEDGQSPHEAYGPNSTCERWDLEILGCCGSTAYNPKATDMTRGGDIIRKMAGSTATSHAAAGKALDEKSQKIQDFINWCVNTANDNSHLYVYGAAGPDNFDCTGFLSYGLMQAGFDIQPCHGSAFDEGVIACGFESISFDPSNGTGELQPGDILSNDAHVELYIGNDQVVGAHSDSHPEADQISVERYYIHPNGWPNFYRFPGVSGVTGPNGNPSSKFGPNSNAYMSNIKDDGHSLEIMPQKKTYCESVYPDYVYVAGNIPCSPLEKTLVNKSAEMDRAGDYNLATGQDMKDLTGIDANSFTGTKAMEQAQRAFDPSKCELEVKVPSAGKPLNNTDPFPVDLKIEELEKHLPRVKQYKIGYSPKIGATKETTAALLHVSDYAEKRLVRLENNMATLMRYIFAMGSRIAINCVYYGGQDHRSWNLAA